MGYEQISLFDFKEKPKHIRLIELFAGIGAQSKALEVLGADFEIWRTCEWSWKSIVAYNAIHMGGRIEDTSHLSYEEVLAKINGVSSDYNNPMTEKQLRAKGEPWAREILGRMMANRNVTPNVSKLTYVDLDIRERERNEYVLFYSYPCLTGDTMILTNNGYKNISEVKKGDMVLTHANQWKPVVNWWKTGNHDTLKISAAPFDELIVTKNHKLLTRDGWKQARLLTKDDMLGMAINQESKIPEWNGIETTLNEEKSPKSLDMSNPNFWWVIGRYASDGRRKANNGIVINCNKRNVKELMCKLDGMFNYCVCVKNNTYKVHIASKELEAFVEKFGEKAENKHLTSVVFDLPIPLLKDFLNGFFSNDGGITQDLRQCCSISKALIYDIGQCIAKAYKKSFFIFKTCVKKTTEEGKIVNQKPYYTLRYNINPQCYYDEKNGIIWFKIRKIEENGNQDVYDIEVADDHSFVANSAIAHNCQDLSNAGKQEGMSKGSGTRSGLLWEVERILLECKEHDCLPQTLIMENVPAVLSKKFKKDFVAWMNSLELMGYCNSYQIMNSKDFGIPQNRNRLFMVSRLNETPFFFPKEMKLKYVLRDFLDKDIPEDYYFSDEFLERLDKCKGVELVK